MHAVGVWLCVDICMRVQILTETRRDCRPCRGGVMGSCEPAVWGLGDKLQASAGAVCRLNHPVISAGLCLAFYMVFSGSNLGPHAYRENI